VIRVAIALVAAAAGFYAGHVAARRSIARRLQSFGTTTASSGVSGAYGNFYWSNS
jgi:hypothetical protein